MEWERMVKSSDFTHSQQYLISSDASTHFQNSGLVTIHKKRSNESNSVSCPFKSFLLLLVLHHKHKYKLLPGVLLTFHKYLFCLLICLLRSFHMGHKGKDSSLLSLKVSMWGLAFSTFSFKHCLSFLLFYKFLVCLTSQKAVTSYWDLSPHLIYSLFTYCLFNIVKRKTWYFYFHTILLFLSWLSCSSPYIFYICLLLLLLLENCCLLAFKVTQRQKIKQLIKIFLSPWWGPFSFPCS